MTRDKVDFSAVRWGSVEWTNLVTLYLRAYESRVSRVSRVSRAQQPILGDRAAAEAVERIDYDFKRIHRMSLPVLNQYLVALRAKQLDDWCAHFLRRHPEAVVLHLGCGLDGRVFRLSVPESVQWFDLDQPEVIELRRRLYTDTANYRMIGSSVTDPGWLSDIPVGRPTLVIAEGLLMYLPPTEVRQLLARLTAQFNSGEMLFDTVSPLGPLASKAFTKGIVKWGIRDARELQDWNPSLHLVERRPVLAGYDRIPVTAVRLLYRVFSVTVGGSYDVLNRFEYRALSEIG
ncbi:class I SAM-dependent methyltransferase [Mycobacterium asiaticum]|uniref:Methyltransferase n=1 Tax=Mycobacterium asiaticum TaxID=1790 RepID=A0A1A3NJJ1_MYCAS|nr:class I SAM-dependent methyltransferase [Mycobacterium asiaticum]OBK21981.1 methyltransferase [Mycobacterium asiaticum]